MRHAKRSRSGETRAAISDSKIFFARDFIWRRDCSYYIGGASSLSDLCDGIFVRAIFWDITSQSRRDDLESFTFKSLLEYLRASFVAKSEPEKLFVNLPESVLEVFSSKGILIWNCILV